MIVLASGSAGSNQLPRLVDIHNRRAIVRVGLSFLELIHGKFKIGREGLLAAIGWKLLGHGPLLSICLSGLLATPNRAQSAVNAPMNPKAQRGANIADRNSKAYRCLSTCSNPNGSCFPGEQLDPIPTAI